MNRTMNGIALAMIVSLTCCSGSAQAQAIWGGEAERGLRPGAYVPFDGGSFPHRYSLEPGSIFYLNLNSQNLYLLDYYDRLDRAKRFGYPLPKKPSAPPTYSHPTGRLGIGFFRFR